MPLLWWDNQWKIMVKHGSLIDYSWLCMVMNGDFLWI